MTLRSVLESRLVERSGLNLQASRFGDSKSYFVGAREIAHFHGDGRMDVRLTRQLIRELRQRNSLDPRVRTRGSSADWATVPLEGEEDVELALEMVDLALEANRPLPRG